MKVPFNMTLHTDGKSSLWSERKAAVDCTEIGLGYVDEDSEDFGELFVKFDPKTWNTNHDGLIYTDRTFIKELRKALDKIGLTGKDVDYSEQGMQGNTYVSLDVGADFLNSWKKKFGNLEWNLFK